MAKAKSKYLEVDCFLCEKPRLSKGPTEDWVEISGLPNRRAHRSCYHEVCIQLRDIRYETDNPLAVLDMVEKRERKRGIEPPERDPKVIAKLIREHGWFKSVRGRKQMAQRKEN